MIKTALGYVSAVIFIYGLATVFSGALKALGKQTLGSWVILVSFYAVALPLSVHFSFNMDMGIIGLWLGPLCGVTVELIAFLIIMIKFINWEDILKDVRKRLNTS